MRDPAAFEARLAEAFDRYAAVAPVAVDARALTRSLAAAHAARPTFGDRWAAAFGARRAAPVLLLLVLALAAAAAGALALRLLDQGPRVFGVFEVVPGGVMPQNLADPASITQAASLPDGRVLILGQGGSPEQEAAIIDSATGMADRLDALATGRYLSSLVSLRDGRVLILGGYTNATDAQGVETSPDALGAQLFDPATRRFEDAGSLAYGRRNAATALLRDGRVLVVGGDPAFSGPHDADAIPSSPPAEVFDPATVTFATTGRPTVERERPGAVTLADGRVLVAGGSTLDPGVGWRPTAAAELYDPATGAFVPTGSMREPRTGHSLTLLADGRVLVAGGVNETGELATAELYDPVTGTFSSASRLVTERSDHVATLLPDGRVLVLGGGNRFGPPRTAELFDPATGRWERAGTAAGVHSFAFLQPDGAVLVIGDSAAERWRPIAPVAVAASATGPGPGFVPTGAPSRNRSGHTATLLADGRVLLTGGRTQDLGAGVPPDVLRSAEVYDPAAGTFTPVGDMSRPRVDHAAALLPDGRVLVVGGDASTNAWGNENPLTAEVFDPATGRFTLGSDRIAWGRIGCSAHLAPLDDGRVILFADCPGGRALQVDDPSVGWAEPVQTSIEDQCLQDFQLNVPQQLVPVGGSLLIPCADASRLGYLVDPMSGQATPIATSARVSGPISAGGVLPDGRVVFATDVDLRALDVASGRIDVLGPLGTPRGGGRVTVLPDGSVLVSGGRGAAPSMVRGYGGRPLAAADLWRPETGVRPVGPMADGRADHTATVLADGRVLLVGGVERSPDRTDPEPVGAEIFDPGALTPAGATTPAP